MTLDEAAELCLNALQFGTNGDLFVRKVPAIAIEHLTRAVLEVMERPDHPVRIIGPRHGEKHFETLLSREEMAVAEDGGDYFRVSPDNRTLNYDAYVSDGKVHVSSMEDFNSQNARLLGVSEMAEILARLPYVQAFLSGAQPDAI